MTTTQEKVNQYNEYINSAREAITSAKVLLAALSTWDRKLVDKNFFNLPCFTVKRDEYSYQKFGIYGKEHDFSTYEYRISLNSDYRIELQSRETAHIKSELEQFIEDKETVIDGYNNSINALSTFNEADLIKDLQALYNKYNQPEVWGKILDTYEVKYPSK